MNPGIEKNLIEKLLLSVQKPGRYIGKELNSIVKQNPLVRIAISYPDLYEVGMSNNGIRILYDVANSIDRVACERVFSAAMDLEAVLRRENLPLFTLESFTPLNQLDMIGFNVSHELLYTNLLQILDLGRIPLLSSERDDSHPIVIAGGDAVSNPFPLSDFIDAFFIGDGEDGIGNILNALTQCKKKGNNRKQTIEAMGEIEGILLPSRFRFTYDGRKVIVTEGKPVTRSVYRRRNSHNPIKPIVPNIRIVQDRAVFEVTRGCRNLCKFCHAGYYNLPYRSYPVDRAEEEILDILSNTGYDELSFSSLSISDYRYINTVLNRILPGLIESGVSISLPSLKVDMNTIPIIEQVSSIRKTSLTFAVESASDEIRSSAYKNVNIEDLFSIIAYVSGKGWKLIKLYFMIGLPGFDKYSEADSIIEMLSKIRKISGKRLKINVTISPFVPKPHTPFQRVRQPDAVYFKETISKIKANVPSSVAIKNHDPAASLLEGILSRGDSRMGQVILKSYLDGCRLDSWKEHFEFNKWKYNLDVILPFWESILDMREKDEILPWGMVKTGYEHVIDSMIDKKLKPVVEGESGRQYHEPLDLDKLSDASEKFKARFNIKFRIRLRMTKTGLLRMISHLDYIEIIKRGLRMAKIPVSSTQGFNKHEKISFGYPVPLGIESESEMCDLDLYGSLPDGMESLINEKLPDGINILGYKKLEKKESLSALTHGVEYRTEVKDDRLFENIKGNLNSRVDIIKETKKGIKKFSFHDSVISFDILNNNSFKVILYAGRESSIRIDRLVMALAETEAADNYKFRIVKTGQFRIYEDELILIN